MEKLTIEQQRKAFEMSIRQTHQQTDHANRIIDTELRKWCIEKALQIHAIKQIDVVEVAKDIFMFVNPPILSAPVAP